MKVNYVSMRLNVFSVYQRAWAGKMIEVPNETKFRENLFSLLMLKESAQEAGRWTSECSLLLYKGASQSEAAIAMTTDRETEWKTSLDIDQLNDQISVATRLVGSHLHNSRLSSSTLAVLGRQVLSNCPNKKKQNDSAIASIDSLQCGIEHRK